jgi:hypothetical protein
MNGRKVLTSVLFFLLFLGFQVLVGRSLNLYGMAFCFVYIGAFLFLPITTPRTVVMLVALVTGLIVDMFCDSPGMHAAASVLTAYLRDYILRSIAPAGGYEDYMEISASFLGLRWLLSFLVPLVFVHSLVLFLIEFGGFSQFPIVLGQAFFSTIFNILLLLLAQYALFLPGSRTV